MPVTSSWLIYHLDSGDFVIVSEFLGILTVFFRKLF